MDDTENRLSPDLLSALLNNPYEHIVVIDTDGIVQFMSKAFERVYPVVTADAIGKHLTEVLPESELAQVLDTGRAQFGDYITIGGEKRITARIPLTKDGTLIGAAGKLMFPDPSKLKLLYEKIESLESTLDHYKDELSHIYGIRYSFEEIIGTSHILKEAKELARLAADNESPVIITGESGTGKELFSQAIHRASNRGRQNFVRVNCAAIPKDLFEAEMFGYEPGAFTGASRKGKPGKFEIADKGTIFLDEIGDMPLKMQIKLMRVLQEKEVERIGGNKPRRINFRIISATNQDLEEAVAKQEFRLDLYYRLNVINIRLPSLREIPQDIPLIFNHILEKLLEEDKRPVPEVTPEAMATLQRYTWPGNVRELRNVAERAMIIHQNNRIKLSDLPIAVQEAVPGPPQASYLTTSLKTLMEDTERNAIAQALKQTENNRLKASQILGIHRTGLYQKMKKYQMV